MDITWHSFDLRSGRRGPQLQVRTRGKFGRLIGEVTSTQTDVLCWDEETATPIPGWDAATKAGRTMLVALDENEQPVWGGMVIRRISNSGAWVQLTLATCEAYFDRRYVTDRQYTDTDQAVIVTGVLEDGTETGIEFTVDAPNTGVPHSAVYAANEDKTVLAVLEDLMALEDGPEFTVDLEWADASRTVLNRVVRVRSRIGRALDLPIAVFELPGCVVDFTYTEDYASEHGANDVLAVSSGQGASRPESARMVAADLLAAGWARFERRFTPATSVRSQADLDSYATAELDAVKDGLRELQLEADLTDAPRVGSDFHLGDDVAAVLTCPRFPARADADGARIPGYDKVLRCIGWDLDLDAHQLVPRLLEVD